MPGMVAGIETAKGLCVIKWVGRKGLGVKTTVYCGDEHNVADGVVQVPDRVLSGEPVMAAQPRNGKPMITICPGCKVHFP